MSAMVELSKKACHFCGKDGTNYKTKVKSQELQAVLCDTHLKEVLQQEKGNDEVTSSTVGHAAEYGRNRRSSSKGNTTDDERKVTP